MERNDQDDLLHQPHVLPEALEKWPVSLFGALLPRHFELIEEINRRHLENVRAKFPGDEDRARRLSLIDESGERYVRMANLAALGSHAITEWPSCILNCSKPRCCATSPI